MSDLHVARMQCWRSGDHDCTSKDVLLAICLSNAYEDLVRSEVASLVSDPVECMCIADRYAAAMFSITVNTDMHRK